MNHEKDQTALMSIYVVGKVLSFCLLLTMFAISFNQIYKTLHQAKEMNFFLSET